MDSAADAKIRLHVEQAAGQGQRIPLSRAQAHYLFAVMRLTVGDAVLVFDGAHGEWRARVVETGKRGGTLEVEGQTRQQDTASDIWLLFAPIKKTRTDFIVEKAVELGVARLQPVQTDYTNAGRIQRDRMLSNVLEAAEQCGTTNVPEVGDLSRLSRLLDTWDHGRRLYFCDEAAPTGTSFEDHAGPAAILIGPEGGFSNEERSRLIDLPFTTRLSLGPRILRAETAAVAALTLWQNRFGDWQ